MTIVLYNVLDIQSIRLKEVVPMNILLTGGAGFIGSHTCVELLNSGYGVVIADDLSNSKIQVIDRIEEITGKRPVFYKIDVSDKPALDVVFKENDIDAVVHFAGYKAVGESCTKPLKYYRNNLDTTLTLLELMEKYDVNSFIFSSSATVYGADAPVPYTEGMQTGGCTNPYGWTKYMIEQILKDASAANEKLSVVLLRYFNPIGAHSSGKIGEDPSGIPNNLLPYITQVASGKLSELGVFGNDYETHDGTGVRDYIHVCDLADGHVLSVKYAAEHKGVQEINLGTGVGYSVLDVVNAFEQANDIKIPYAIKPRRDGDLPEYYADASKALKLLGWSAKRDLKAMCRDSWNWQKNNPNGYEY